VRRRAVLAGGGRARTAPISAFAANQRMVAPGGGLLLIILR
jgi:hypothetical protein